MSASVGRIEELVDQVFKVFDDFLKPYTHVILTYSGGKDSTTVAFLLREWIEERKRYDLKITLLHNDTLSEISPMEIWARNFLSNYVKEMRKMGIDISSIITTPPYNETFYWRTIVKGYVAPTNNFRWCVNLLKIKPSERIYGKISLVNDNGKTLVLTGIRRDESSERAKLILKRNKSRFAISTCSAAQCTSSYLLDMQHNGIHKLHPIIDWKTLDVMAYLSSRSRELLRLYPIPTIRYGCWHCTLIKIQQPLIHLGREMLYFEVLRIVYRTLSDLGYISRTPKQTGYSKWGPLNRAGRHILWFGMQQVERFSKHRLYGLDETGFDGITLREVFYKLPPSIADDLILNKEKDRRRYIPMRYIRNLPTQTYEKIVENLYKKFSGKVKTHPSREELQVIFWKLFG